MNDYEACTEVKKRYLTILNDMAKIEIRMLKIQKKDFTRKRKLSFQDTINTIVTYDAGSIGRCIKRYIPKLKKLQLLLHFFNSKKIKIVCISNSFLQI